MLRSRSRPAAASTNTFKKPWMSLSTHWPARLLAATHSLGMRRSARRGISRYQHVSRSRGSRGCAPPRAILPVGPEGPLTLTSEASHRRFGRNTCITTCRIQTVEHRRHTGRSNATRHLRYLRPTDRQQFIHIVEQSGLGLEPGVLQVSTLDPRRSCCRGKLLLRTLDTGQRPPRIDGLRPPPAQMVPDRS